VNWKTPARITTTDTKYEQRRQLNITKNHELLNRLPLGNPNGKYELRKANRTPKRRNFGGAPPMRDSHPFPAMKQI